MVESKTKQDVKMSQEVRVNKAIMEWFIQQCSCIINALELLYAGSNGVHRFNTSHSWQVTSSKSFEKPHASTAGQLLYIIKSMAYIDSFQD